jgi:hypothetical protein
VIFAERVHDDNVVIENNDLTRLVRQKNATGISSVMMEYYFRVGRVKPEEDTLMSASAVGGTSFMAHTISSLTASPGDLAYHFVTVIVTSKTIL